jgi:lipopolysaccharide export system protein LptA
MIALKIILFSLIVTCLSYAQNINLITDTLNLKPDSLILIEQKRSDIDTIVFAESKDSISFNIKNKRMLIYGNGQIKYRLTEIKSGFIKINFDRNEINAEGIKNDSTNKLEQTPILTEGSDSYKGIKMRYNFKTQRGSISLAQTE